MAERKTHKTSSRRRDSRRGRPKVCPFASGQLGVTDYRDVAMLKRFLSDTGKILPRRRTGVSAKYQRQLAKTIKRARVLALLPYAKPLVRR
jgi:small subunit ribosomal protein S18